MRTVEIATPLTGNNGVRVSDFRAIFALQYPAEEWHRNVRKQLEKRRILTEEIKELLEGYIVADIDALLNNHLSRLFSERYLWREKRTGNGRSDRSYRFLKGDKFESYPFPKESPDDPGQSADDVRRRSSLHQLLRTDPKGWYVAKENDDIAMWIQGKDRDNKIAPLCDGFISALEGTVVALSKVWGTAYLITHVDELLAMDEEVNQRLEASGAKVCLYRTRLLTRGHMLLFQELEHLRTGPLAPEKMLRKWFTWEELDVFFSQNVIDYKNNINWRIDRAKQTTTLPHEELDDLEKALTENIRLELADAKLSEQLETNPLSQEEIACLRKTLYDERLNELLRRVKNGGLFTEADRAELAEIGINVEAGTARDLTDLDKGIVLAFYEYVCEKVGSLSLRKKNERTLLRKVKEAIPIPKAIIDAQHIKMRWRDSHQPDRILMLDWKHRPNFSLSYLPPWTAGLTLDMRVVDISRMKPDQWEELFCCLDKGFLEHGELFRDFAKMCGHYEQDHVPQSATELREELQEGGALLACWPDLWKKPSEANITRWEEAMKAHPTSPLDDIKPTEADISRGKEAMKAQRPLSLGDDV